MREKEREKERDKVMKIEQEKMNGNKSGVVYADENVIQPTEIDYLVCGNDMIPNKPSPDPLLKICKELGVEPENAMMVGDTISDVHAGINAKFGRVVAVLSGGYKSPHLIDADSILRNIDDLIKIFPKLNCNE